MQYGTIENHVVLNKFLTMHIIIKCCECLITGEEHYIIIKLSTCKNYDCQLTMFERYNSKTLKKMDEYNKTPEIQSMQIRLTNMI